MKVIKYLMLLAVLFASTQSIFAMHRVPNVQKGLSRVVKVAGCCAACLTVLSLYNLLWSFEEDFYRYEDFDVSLCMGPTDSRMYDSLNYIDTFMYFNDLKICTMGYTDEAWDAFFVRVNAGDRRSLKKFEYLIRKLRELPRNEKFIENVCKRVTSLNVSSCKSLKSDEE